MPTRTSRRRIEIACRVRRLDQLAHNAMEGILSALSLYPISLIAFRATCSAFNALASDCGGRPSISLRGRAVGLEFGDTLPRLKFALNVGIPFDSRFPAYLAGRGSWKLLAWALEAGCEVDAATFRTCVQKGNARAAKACFERLKEARERVELCTDASVAHRAMLVGKLDLLEFLDTQGFAMDDELLGEAMVLGNLPIVAYLRQAFGRSPDLASISETLRRGHVNVMQFLLDAETCIERQEAMVHAAIVQTASKVSWNWGVSALKQLSECRKRSFFTPSMSAWTGPRKYSDARAGVE